MNGEKPKPKTWEEIIVEIDNDIQAAEQFLIMKKAAGKAAREQI